jgi:DNA helicase HerA-like ATPase
MNMIDPICLARNGAQDLVLLPALANRHGLITGATGTGKTVTLQKLAESFAAVGVPVFMADVKGDLSGIGAVGVLSEKFKAAIAERGTLVPEPVANTPVFWDLWGKSGHPVRTTVSDMGPVLLARLFNLNDTQAGVLQLVFKIADDNGLLLLDVKDLRAMLNFVGENAKQFTTSYGNISAASIGAIQRALMALEQEGGDGFFGEPMLNIQDLIQTDAQGRGVVNILAADKLMLSPKVYATFLLWLLSELFEQLPEVGDLPKPKLVFFFDEAHLLFNDAPPALVEKVEQVVRLIRSKGVGIYFVTQNPLDIPDSILGQLGNRVQHALRAFTPRDQKAVKTAAQTLRANPAFDVEAAITELGVGEALISLLDEKGRPTIVERAFINVPGSRIGPLTPEERSAHIANSLVAGIYEAVEDRQSAFEHLQTRAAQAGAPKASPASRRAEAVNEPEASGKPIFGGLNDILFGSTGPRGGQRDGVAQIAAKTVARTIASEMGRQIMRGVLGSILGGGKSRR